VVTVARVPHWRGLPDCQHLLLNEESQKEKAALLAALTVELMTGNVGEMMEMSACCFPFQNG